jgi:hypothetical protein
MLDGRGEPVERACMYVRKNYRRRACHDDIWRVFTVRFSTSVACPALVIISGITPTYCYRTFAVVYRVQIDSFGRYNGMHAANMQLYNAACTCTRVHQACMHALGATLHKAATFRKCATANSSVTTSIADTVRYVYLRMMIDDTGCVDGLAVLQSRNTPAVTPHGRVTAGETTSRQSVAFVSLNFERNF